MKIDTNIDAFHKNNYTGKRFALSVAGLEGASIGGGGGHGTLL